MGQNRVPWKVEWKAAGLESGPLTPAEEEWAEQLKTANREFLEKHPYRPSSSQHKPQRPALSLAWALPLAAAAAFWAFWAFPSGSEVNTGEHIKGGGTELTVYRQSTAGVQKLAPQAQVRAGDVLQAAYRVNRNLQGALVSVDGDGNVTTHLAKEGHSVTLVPGNEQALDFSYELDRAPDFEVFILLTSEQPFELESVRQILKKVAWKALTSASFGPNIAYQVVPLVKVGSK